jgi:hypothetical protein
MSSLDLFVLLLPTSAYIELSFSISMVSHMFFFLCSPIMCLYVLSFLRHYLNMILSLNSYLHQDTVFILNVREYRRGNQKWTIQRHWEQKVSVLLSVPMSYSHEQNIPIPCDHNKIILMD